jgi:hypothetical protein
MNVRKAVVPVVCLLVSISAAIAQPQVYWLNRYERVLAIVPMVGNGTAADPQRPAYTPILSVDAAPPTTEFLGFVSIPSDDGKFALVEFVARSQSAFKVILADTSIQTFLKGRDSRQVAEAAFQKYKKGFSIANFGVRIP